MTNVDLVINPTCKSMHNIWQQLTRDKTTSQYREAGWGQTARGQRSPVVSKLWIQHVTQRDAH